LSYQGLDYEVDLKYGDRDVSEGSSVFSRSKDGRTGDGPLPSKSTNQNFLIVFKNIKSIKKKCPSVVRNR
jgi:hypothetical protein